MNTLTDLVEHAWHQYRTVEQLDVGFEEIPTPKKMAHWIDHTQLKPTATLENIQTLCAEAKKYEFASVCVHPVWVADCFEPLRQTRVLVCTVAGFPLGANTTKIKAEETRVAVADGAREIDMVINIGRLKERNYTVVFDDIRAVVDAADGHGVKVIIEACLLTEKEKVAACILSKEAGAAFVKTSTGFSEHGAASADVTLMRRVVGKDVGVKAAGGIRDYYTAVEMIRAGAGRIGASSSVAIVTSDV